MQKHYGVSPEELSHVAGLLQSGQIVALPTETVYGLACLALNKFAVAKVFKAKQRPANNPLIIHVSDLTEANLVSADFFMADLTSTNLESANLHDVDFSKANLTEAHLIDAILTDAHFYSANLTRAQFGEADLTGAYFFQADLTGANLSGVLLGNSDFEGAKFCGTRMPWGIDDSSCPK